MDPEKLEMVNRSFLSKLIMAERFLRQMSPWTNISLDKHLLGQTSPWTNVATPFSPKIKIFNFKSLVGPFL
jgi:hypothetical protein